MAMKQTLKAISIASCGGIDERLVVAEMILSGICSARIRTHKAGNATSSRRILVV